MNESKRIKADYEHFLRTGDDYPHHQRHYDKAKSERYAFGFFWCAAIVFGLSVLAFICEVMK